MPAIVIRERNDLGEDRLEIKGTYDGRYFSHTIWNSAINRLGAGGRRDNATQVVTMGNPPASRANPEFKGNIIPFQDVAEKDSYLLSMIERDYLADLFKLGEPDAALPWENFQRVAVGSRHMNGLRNGHPCCSLYLEAVGDAAPAPFAHQRYKVLRRGVAAATIAVAGRTTDAFNADRQAKYEQAQAMILAEEQNVATAEAIGS